MFEIHFQTTHKSSELLRSASAHQIHIHFDVFKFLNYRVSFFSHFSLFGCVCLIKSVIIQQKVCQLCIWNRCDFIVAPIRARWFMRCFFLSLFRTAREYGFERTNQEQPQTDNGTKLHKSQNIRKISTLHNGVLWLLPFFVGARNIFYISTHNNYMASGVSGAILFKHNAR